MKNIMLIFIAIFLSLIILNTVSCVSAAGGKSIKLANHEKLYHLCSIEVCGEGKEYAFYSRTCTKGPEKCKEYFLGSKEWTVTILDLKNENDRNLIHYKMVLYSFDGVKKR